MSLGQKTNKVHKYLGESQGCLIHRIMNSKDVSVLHVTQCAK